MDWKPVPGVTLVSYAAHLAIPNGEGVNLAMTDALELACKIVEYEGSEEYFERAVRDYEVGMFPRGRQLARAGRWQIECLGSVRSPFF